MHINSIPRIIHHINKRAHEEPRTSAVVSWAWVKEL